MKTRAYVFLFSLFLLQGLVSDSSSITAISTKADSNKEGLQSLAISDVKISAPQFNPRVGERVEIKFSLSKEALVTFKIFDPDFELVTTLMEKERKKARAHTVFWNGKDCDGSLVPDEAYFFTIEARDKEGQVTVYDPITFSGGELYNLDKADFNKETNKITYHLAHSGRVLIRMGIQQGPLLRTLVDWKPRPAGLNTEYWDGKDEWGFVDLRNDPSFAALIRYFTLPENALITVGNDKALYRDYKSNMQAKRPEKEHRDRTFVPNGPISPYFFRPRTLYGTPKIQMTFSEVKQFTADGSPVIEGQAVLRVDIEDKDKALFNDQKTEIYFFLDNRFLMEDGQPKIPYAFYYNFSRTREGEHILTVNLLGEDSQIATASQKVMIKKGPGSQTIN